MADRSGNRLFWWVWIASMVVAGLTATLVVRSISRQSAEPRYHDLLMPPPSDRPSSNPAGGAPTTLNWAG